MPACPLAVLGVDCLPAFLAQRALVFDEVQEDLNVSCAIVVGTIGPATFDLSPCIILVILNCTCTLRSVVTCISIFFFLTLTIGSFSDSLATCTSGFGGPGISASLSNRNGVTKAPIQRVGKGDLSRFPRWTQHKTGPRWQGQQFGQLTRLGEVGESCESIQRGCSCTLLQSGKSLLWNSEND